MSGKSLVVIGGGAAGFFCAVNAARMNPQLQVTIIEKTNKLLSKVKVSGGGRCNVTHALFEIDALSRRYPRGQNFVKKTFYQFSTADTIDWFKQRGMALKTESDGRMFPVTDSSQTVIDCLMEEAKKTGVTVLLQTEAKRISRTEGTFTLETSTGQALYADYVCVACGGYPKASLFQWLENLGHTVADPLPSLFTFNLPKHPITELMGVSVPLVRVKIRGTKLTEEGPVLITHWGLSGPAVLRLSAWGARELAQMGYDFNAHINWLPHYNEQTLKAAFGDFRRDLPTKKISNHNIGNLPNRLWVFLLAQAGIGEDMRIADLASKLENTLIRNLVDYVVTVKGKTTFKEEFVTAGGINLSEVDANTMMSRKVPNLYFAGEVLDVDGITGGFNFQHAWTSGWIAARSIARTGAQP